MKTIYKTDRAEVILGDARDALASIEKESVDLVIIDPPYGQEWQSNRRVERFDQLAGDDADREGVHAIISECVRVVGQNRHLYVFGPADVLDGLKVSEPACLIWDKIVNGMGGTQRAWSMSHEPITFAVSKHRHAGEAGKDTVPARLRRGSVLRFQRPTGRNVRHPSEKPVALLAELVESSSRAGELVLDACAGVGSTGVAAILRGRRALLIELNERYATIAAERLAVAEELADRMDRA